MQNRDYLPNLFKITSSPLLDDYFMAFDVKSFHQLHNIEPAVYLGNFYFVGNIIGNPLEFILVDHLAIFIDQRKLTGLFTSKLNEKLLTIGWVGIDFGIRYFWPSDYVQDFAIIGQFEIRNAISQLTIRILKLTAALENIKIGRAHV